MSAWQVPEGCIAKSKLPGAGSAPGQGNGHKEQGAKGKGGGKYASGKGAGKESSRQRQQDNSRRGNGRGQGGGRAASSAGDVLASIQALSKMEPLLRALGLAGKGKGRRGRKRGPRAGPNV